ncbi:MAG: hypothetical protein HKO62_02565 [Gammaproteobacteria bacterium]|nr:hypothetical protein [Gammaproteobacteria bacterium]NNL99606.1 hypothetical protein [Gammaproteobacteria bacterium]
MILPKDMPERRSLPVPAGPPRSARTALLLAAALACGCAHETTVKGHAARGADPQADRSAQRADKRRPLLIDNIAIRTDQKSALLEDEDIRPRVRLHAEDLELFDSIIGPGAITAEPPIVLQIVASEQYRRNSGANFARSLLSDVLDAAAPMLGTTTVAYKYSASLTITATFTMPDGATHVFDCETGADMERKAFASGAFDDLKQEIIDSCLRRISARMLKDRTFVAELGAE